MRQPEARSARSQTCMVFCEIFFESNSEVPSSTMASHLELGETRIPDVDHVDADELVMDEELLHQCDKSRS